jgi:hypothetical protein
MKSARLTGRRVEQMVERLSERDLDIVLSVRRLRVVQAQQVERLHFIAGTPLSNARLCRRVLQRLTDLRVLHRLERRIGGVRAGSASYVYALGVAGQRLAGERGPAGGRRLRRPWTPSGPFVAHALAVSELYVRAVEWQRAHAGYIERFDTEPDCWRTYHGAAGERVLLKPDAFVISTSDTYEDRWFIELDRATESLRRIARQADGYRRYWQSGDEQTRSGVFPRVLFVVPHKRRRDDVVKMLEGQPADAWQLFQVACFDDASSIIAGGEP